MQRRSALRPERPLETGGEGAQPNNAHGGDRPQVSEPCADGLREVTPGLRTRTYNHAQEAEAYGVGAAVGDVLSNAQQGNASRRNR